MIGQPFSVPSVIIAVFTVPLIFRLVPQNRIYGIRTRKTMSDPEAWYAINQTGGILLFVSSVIYLIFAWQLPMAGQHDPRFDLWLSHLLVFALPIALSVIWLKGYSKRYVEKKD